jgi:MarR family transcriptional regulator, organic hydroperoxide resistance regulator
LKLDINNFEQSLFELFDQIKVLISQDTWENILLNCTKNEMLVLMLMYRGSEVNMTQIADYLNVPLNTATGIVTRMEKKDMIRRIRSVEDKRVVTLALTEGGQQQIDAILKTFVEYGKKLFTVLTIEEIAMISSIFDKVIALIQEESKVVDLNNKTVRKIIID